MKEAKLHIEYSGIHANDEAAIRKSILRSLIYFDLFNYPLTLQEIVLFGSKKFTNLHEVNRQLNELVDSIHIYRFGEYYSLKNDNSVVDRRIAGNKSANSVMARLQKRSQFIHRFPFVRSVNVSGSLSKNYFDETTDFDFFVITAANRVWITRMLLTLYKKIFLLNNRKYFCINYYIDTEDLLIPDKNLFSATEIITLKNQTGEKVFADFLKINAWVSDYFPNYTVNESHLNSFRRFGIKRRIEKLLAGKSGDKVDTLCRKITLRFLKKRYHWLSDEVFELNLRTKKHASKHHPQGFQLRVMKAFEEKCIEFEKQTGLQLS